MPATGLVCSAVCWADLHTSITGDTTHTVQNSRRAQDFEFGIVRSTYRNKHTPSQSFPKGHLSTRDRLRVNKPNKGRAEELMSLVILTIQPHPLCHLRFK